MDIIAENISDDPEYRKFIKKNYMQSGVIVTSSAKKEVTERTAYEMYYDFSEAIKTIPSHRILAINRGEKESVLSVKINIDKDYLISNGDKEFIYTNSYWNIMNRVHT